MRSQRTFLLVLLIFTLAFKVFSQSYQDFPLLLINEVHNENINNDDMFIEILVLKTDDLPLNQNNYLPRIIIDDSNTGPSFQSGYISLDPKCIANLLPGDLIVIHDSNTDVSNSGDATLFNINDPCVKKWNNFPNSVNSSYEDATEDLSLIHQLSDYIEFSTNNKFQIRIDENYIIHLNQDGSNNYSLSSENYTDYSNLTPSLGIANNPGNADLISSLSSQSKLKINCELTSFNQAVIEITPGNNPNVPSQFPAYTGPYTLVADDYTELGITNNYVSVYELECGENNFEIVDILGRSDNCTINIKPESIIELNSCNSSAINIQNLLCDGYTTKCIYFKEGDKPGVTFTNKSEIPEVTPLNNNYPVEVKYSDSKGNILYELFINIIIINTDQSCGDDTDCYTNFKYDNECNCLGESVIDFEIYKTVEGECLSQLTTLEVPNIFDNYEWRLDGHRLGNENVIATPISGLASVTVQLGGCIETKDIIIENNNEDINIQADKDIICFEGEKVRLSIDPSLANNCIWYNEIGHEIGFDVAQIDVTLEGEYSVKVESCERIGSIEVKSGVPIDFEIKADSPVFCGPELLLEIQPEPNAEYNVLWSVDSDNEQNSIMIDGPGLYEVSITSESGCVSYDMVEVLDGSNPNSIHDIMILQGFELYEYDLIISKIQNNTNNITRASCPQPIDNSGEELTILREDNTETSINEEVSSLVELGCNICDFNVGGFIDLYDCDSNSFNLDEFLQQGSELDGYVKALAVKDLVNNKLKVYFKITYDIYQDCVNTNNNLPELGKEIIYDIICAKNNNESELLLNYDSHPTMSGFVSDNVTILDNRLLSTSAIQNFIIGDFERIMFANYKLGEKILIPSTIDGINVESICDRRALLEGDPNIPPGLVPENLDGPFYIYNFEYLSDNDTNCGDFFKVIVSPEEHISFSELLNNYSSNFNLQTLIDATCPSTPGEEIFVETVANVPECFIDDDLLCELINKTLISEEDIEIRKESLNNLLRTNSKIDALRIKDCINNEINNGPYLVDDIFDQFGNDTQIFQSLANIFYVLADGIDPSSISGGNEVYVLFSNQNVEYKEEFKDPFVFIDYKVRESPTPASIDNFSNEIKDDFYYYTGYLADASGINEGLPIRSGFEQVSVGIIPGLYVPFILKKGIKQATITRLIQQAVNLGFILAAVDVVVLHNATRLFTIEGAFAFADLNLTALEILCSSEDFCDYTGGEFCKNWKEISGDVAWYSLTGRFLSGAANRVSKVNALKSEWEDGAKNHFQKKWNGDSRFTAIDNMLSHITLYKELRELYSSNIPDDILRGIAAKLPNEGWVLTSRNLVTKIDNLPNNGLQFLDDILKTANAPGKIGRYLESLSEGIINAWKNLFDANVSISLRTNIKFLNRFSENPKLVNYVNSLNLEGKADLANNVDIWIKRNDARAALKNGNYDEAISILDGTAGTPVIYNGANYVDALQPPISASPATLQAIINSTTDVSAIASKLGVSESVVQAAKQHLFITEHLVETAPGVFTRGRFATFDHITQWWNSAANGTISSIDANALRKLLGHEYIESVLMQQGVVYRQLGTPSAGKYGAHELSVGEGTGNFSHWESALGRNLPPFRLSLDLSNIDYVVDQIKIIEGIL